MANRKWTLEQLDAINFRGSDILVAAGAGSGKTFDWNLLEAHQFTKPWFLAGGINLENIEKAMALNPFAIDVSSGVETDGVKNREKIIQLTQLAKTHSKAH